MTTPVALVGVTASGKSRLAHALAREMATVEIATVDAMTVYRDMDIATAKPSGAERAEVPYHLLDLVEPSDEFSVAEFQTYARRVAADVAARQKYLLYVGGTGLYGRAVIDDMTLPGQFPEIRASLERRADDDLGALYVELERRDPLAASRTTVTNARRIVRALEVIEGTGQSFSSFGPGLVSYPPSRVVQIGLRVELSVIDERVSERFTRWMDEGLLEEVRALAARPGGLSRTARQAVGYRELLAHLAGETDLATAVAGAVAATKRVARRQRRWFTRDPRIEWHDDPGSAAARVRAALVEPTRAVGD